MTTAEKVLRCTALAGGGWGVAHDDDATWMLRGALPGETVRAEPVFERGGVLHGQVTGVLEGHHPARLASPCPHAARCGGCDWPHVDAGRGAALKAQVAEGAARSHPGLRATLAHAPVTPSPPAYRLRARLHWDPERGVLGFYAPHSWEVVPIPGCTVVSPALTRTLPALRTALAASCTVPADLEWLEDLDGATAVVGLRPARSGPRRLDPELLPPRGALPAPVAGAWILTPVGVTTSGWGERSVTMALPTPLKVPIGAFFQGNRHLVPWLFGRVRELAGDGFDGVWDLHAGVGFLAAAAAGGSATSPVLVEPFRPAARAAAANLPGARVFAGRTAEAYLRRHRHLPAESLVLLDPPRSGLSRELRRRLAGWGPRRILALSCDPATWTRDTAALLDAGYELRHVELADLFPFTHHVETLSILERA
ncbi:MAG TPA: class I SAM-dependent RNA methyltransferase [Acidobacteria bacterium]|nr:class I SAM-dependent RNA methyltransferase [Acidobacteriota bacterium]